MLKRSIVVMFGLVTSGLGGSAAFAGDGASISVRPASMIQDERADEARALVLQVENSRVRIDVSEFLPRGGTAPTPGISVAMILPDLSKKYAITDSQGTATFTDVAADQVVAVTATTADNQHMAYGARTVAHTDPGPPPSAQLFTMRAPHDELLRQADGRARLPGGVASEGPLAAADVEPIGADYYRVLLSPNGTIEGRVYSLVPDASRSYALSDMNITILQDGQPIRGTISDAEGRFVVEDLSPGHYGVIAAGHAGYAAYAFQAVQAELLPPVAAVSVKTVSVVQPTGTPMLQIGLVPPQMVPGVIEEIVAAGGPPAAGAAPPLGPLPLAPAFAAGAALGSGGGGGGSGSGTPGIGGLIGLAAIGGAIAAIASEDDEDEIVLSPALPLRVR